MTSFRKPTSWHSLWIGLSVWLLVQIVGFTWLNDWHQPRFLDPDSYMRLVRMQEWEQTGEWFNRKISRSNVPYGETLHWTRPLDLILAAGTSILRPWLGFARALESWAMVSAPVIGLGGLAALHFFYRRTLPAAVIAPVFFLSLWQPGLQRVWVLGQADHHSLLTTLFIFGTVATFFSTQPRWKAGLLPLPDWVTGLSAILGMWVSVEFLLPIGWWLMWRLWRSLFQPERIRRDLSLALLITLGIWLAVFLEHAPSSGWPAEPDMISSLYARAFTWATLSLGLCLILWARIPARLGFRLLALTGAGAVGCAILWITDPEFFRGPYARVPQALAEVWLHHVDEVQPLFAHGWSSVSSALWWAWPPILATCLAVVRLVSIPKRSRWLLSRGAFLWSGWIVFGMISLLQIRWVTYWVVVSIPLLSPFVTWSFLQAARLPRALIPTARVGCLFLLTFGGPFLIVLLNPTLTALTASPSAKQAKTLSQPSFQLSELISLLETRAAPGDGVLLHLNLSTELLYRTSYRVLATPYHRNADGILTAYQAVGQLPAAEGAALLYQRGIRWLAFGQLKFENQFYRCRPGSLLATVAQGSPPEGVIALSSPTDPLRLFQLQAPEPGPGSTPRPDHDP